MRELTRSFASGAYSTPKTILGFFAIVVGIVVSGGVAAMWALDGSSGLLIAILAFAGAFVTAITVAVLLIAWRDPTKLQLGQISGADYLQVMRMAQGDDVAGEFTDTVVLPPSAAQGPPAPPALGPTSSDEPQEDESE